MLVRHLMEKREAKRALTQQSYAYDPTPISRRSWEKDQVYGQGQRDSPNEWVDEKDTQVRRQSQESLRSEPPTYKQAMKGASDF
jgi:hypothetical protein